MNRSRLWFIYTILTMIAWGIWGAFIGRPAKNGFPDTLSYVVWSLTMIPPALIALRAVSWSLDRDRRSVLLGCTAGILGAGGQLILFKTVTFAPAYLVFPFIALSPVITIVMALLLSGERAGMRGWIGIILAVTAGVLLACEPSDGSGGDNLLWILPAMVVFLAWGIQGYVISKANRVMRAESIFFYMMLTGLALTPVAFLMTDFSKPINSGWDGPWLAAAIQILNSAGALLLVYAFRHGRAMIVAPLVNAGGPVITIGLSLMLAGSAQAGPGALKYSGMIAAVIAAILMALEEESKPAAGPAAPKGGTGGA